MSLLSFIRALFSREPIRLAIVRRYQDANGSYVGELYRFDTVSRRADTFMGYRMIGMSLDTLALDFHEENTVWSLDTRHDFLEPMPKGVVRVGSLTPEDNDNVRREIGNVPRWRIRLEVQNRFIEHVMDARETR